MSNSPLNNNSPESTPDIPDEDIEFIAVIGMAVRCPGADTPEELWNILKNGKETIRHFTPEELRPFELDPQQTERASNYVRAKGILQNIDHFDAAFFGYSPREAAQIDPQQRIWLELAREALERANYCHPGYEGAVGVFAGAFPNAYLFRNLLTNRHEIEEFARGRFNSEFAKLINTNSYSLPTRTAYKLNLKGPAINVQTACSTSLVAVSMAVQNLLNYESDIALAGGICISIPQETGYFYQEGAIASRDGHCRPYDANACGTVFSNGAGVVVLKRLSEALADGDNILSVIRGTAVNNDGANKISYTAPSVAGQAEAIAAAQAMAGVDADSISYIEGHGTATPIGDPIEISALTRAFESQTTKKQFCGLGSIKSNIGHLDAAAGVLGLIKVVLSLQHKQLPPTVHYTSPNPEIPFEKTPFYVVDKLLPWKSNGPRRAGVSSFGVGGTNAHVVLEQAPPPSKPSNPSNRLVELLLLSAKTKEALDDAQQNLASHLENKTAIDNLADVAFTLATTREPFPFRRAIVVNNNTNTLSRDIEAPKSGAMATGTVFTANKTVFLFPGQGSAFCGMGKELFDNEPAYKKAVNTCCEIANTFLDEPLTPLVDGSASAELFSKLMGKNEYAQLAAFTVDYATGKLWEHFGIEPDAVLGHSLGEWVAMVFADVIDVASAIKCVFHRGQLMEKLGGNGAAAAVRATSEELTPLLTEKLTLAAQNSPQSCLVSGESSDVKQLVEKLNAKNIRSTLLDITVAVHSPALDKMIAPFQAELDKVTFNPPKIDFYSAAAGKQLTPQEVQNSSFWASQARTPVQFSKALLEMLSDTSAHVIEVGPGRALTALLRHHTTLIAKQNPVITMALIEGVSSQEQAYAAFGKLWTFGKPIDWNHYYSNEQRAKVTLPTYPFQRQSYWKDSPSIVELSNDTDVVDSALPSATKKQQDVSPKDQISTIMRIVSEVSGMSPNELDRKTTFNDFGFDSLLLVQLAEQLTAKLNISVKYRSLYSELSTIEKLEAIYEETSAPATSNTSTTAQNTSLHNLINLKESGNRIPLVLIHGEYIEKLLPRFVHDEQPILAFFPQGSDGESVSIRTIEGIAQRYVSELLQVRPNGPFSLCGYSFGGAVAFEMAQLLLQKGHDVKIVMLVDTGSPKIRSKKGDLSFVEHQTKRARWVLRRIKDRVKAELYIIKQQSIPPQARKGYIMSVFHQAFKLYRPKPLHCPVTVFYASQSAYSEPERGWTSYTPQGLDTVMIEGNHRTLPFCDDLGKIIAQKLDDIEKNQINPNRNENTGNNN